MTLQERLAAEQAKAVQLYGQRQEIEAQKHRLLQHAQGLDLALMKSDGAIELLQALIAEAT